MYSVVDKLSAFGRETTMIFGKTGAKVFCFVGTALLAVACMNYISYFSWKPDPPMFSEDADADVKALQEILIRNELANIARNPSSAEMHFTKDLFRDVELEIAGEHLNRALLFTVGGVLFLGIGVSRIKKFRIDDSASTE